jgi:O-antigen/teichoic acid export membrane protein
MGAYPPGITVSLGGAPELSGAALDPDAKAAAGARRSRVLRLFSSAVFDQAVLSAASLLVGLVLIRHTSDQQYGYFILVTNLFLLLASLQYAFIYPGMVVRMTRLDEAGRGTLAAALYREQRRVLVFGVGALLPLVALLWWIGVLDGGTGPLLLVTLVVLLAVLSREYLRMVLLAWHRPGAVLKGDLPYVVLMVLGAAGATLTARPTVAAVVGIGVAALLASLLMLPGLRSAPGWSLPRAGGLLREMAPLSLWSAAGAAVHWTFSQGYPYLVAGMLDVGAVAAIAATRLLMMPVNLLSTGIKSMMLPLTSGWLHQHGAPRVLRRLAVFGLALALASLCYFLLMWLLRDWIFAVVLKKQFADRDRLLLLWSAIFLLMVIRDQLISMLVARERFRQLLALTLASAVVSVAVSCWGMLHYGQIGALIGMITGELVNLGGVLTLALQEPAYLPQPKPV